MANLSRLTTTNPTEMVNFIKDNNCEEIHCDISDCVFLSHDEIGIKTFISLIEKYGYLYTVSLQSLLKPTMIKVDKIIDVCDIDRNVIEVNNDSLRLIISYDEKDEFIKFVNLINSDHMELISDDDDIVYSAIIHANILGTSFISDNITKVYEFIKSNSKCELEIDIAECQLIVPSGIHSEKLKKIILNHGYIEDGADDGNLKILSLDEAVETKLMEDDLKTKFLFKEDIILTIGSENIKDGLFIIEKIISGVIEILDSGDNVCYTVTH